MICPNCGANNSARATFCKRCRQRLPLGGLASGVSYPRRRYASTGNSRAPIVAALLLAVTGLVVGVLLVSLARPGGNQGPIAVVTSTPSLLPTFSQDTPTPSPTPPPLTSFAPLPTPFPPTPTPDLTPTPTAEVTPTATATTPSTPKPPKTPKPTKEPTPTPEATPKPTDTPAPTATPFDCSTVAGTGNADSVTLTNNDNKATPPANKVWCLNTVEIKWISGAGTIALFRNQKQIASADCTVDGTCTPLTGKWEPPLRVLSTQTLTYLYNCDEATQGPCPPVRQATITVDYEQFPAP